MVTPFEEVWEYVDKIPGSFTRVSAEKYYSCALISPGIVAEIGVDQGRSASILLFAARHTLATVLLVDSWESCLAPNEGKVSTRFHLDFLDVHYTICHGRSVEAAANLAPSAAFSLVHIDADHYGDSPSNDCIAWLPLIAPGGLACFHDYHSCFPAVTAAVDEHTAGWEDLGDWDGLAIRRKPL